MKSFIHSSFISLILFSFSACSTWFDDPQVDRGVKGGVVGGLAGAGTGAAIGAIIANGDIAASAALGGAIGIPAGVLIGVTLLANNERSEIEANNEIIQSNYTYITTRQAHIDNLREEIETDFKSIRLDKQLRREIYTGHTLGNRNR